MYELLAEFIGSFIFFSVILLKPEPLAIGIALMASILFSASISGGHLNPCVSLMFYIKNVLTFKKFVQYVLVQILGALSAYYFVKSSSTINF